MNHELGLNNSSSRGVRRDGRRGDLLNVRLPRSLWSLAMTFLIILNSLFLIPPALATPPPAVVDECDRLSTPMERLRCRNARLFSQSNPTDAQGQTALTSRVGALIRTVLSLTGIIFLLITVYSGIQWMMAGGNEEIIKKTKARVTRAAIGLVIIVGSWVITNFILNAAFRGGPRATPGTITIPGTGGNVRGFVR